MKRVDIPVIPVSAKLSVDIMPLLSVLRFLIEQNEGDIFHKVH